VKVNCFRNANNEVILLSKTGFATNAGRKIINYDDPTNKTKSTSEEVAYITFKVLGYLSLFLAFGVILLATGVEPGVVGFMIFLPTTTILVPALILGAWFSLIVWQDRHLNIIKALTLLIAIALFLFQKF